MRIVKSLAAATLATAGLLALAPAASAAPAAPAATTGPVAPISTKCAPAAFDKAGIALDSYARHVTLVVSGMKSATNVEIRLTPVIYIRQPEYWLIEVIGCMDGIGLPVLTPYTVKLDVTSTLGTKGIEVQGSNQSVMIPVPGIR